MTTDEDDATEKKGGVGGGRVEDGSDDAEANEERRERVAGTVRDKVVLVRNVFDDHPQVVVVGIAAGFVVALAVVWYALSVSLLGTVLAVLAWAGFTAVLAHHGVTYKVLERSALGAGLFLLAIPTVVRLTTRTIDAAGNADGAEGLPFITSIIVLGVLGIFSAWAIRTTVPDSDRDR